MEDFADRIHLLKESLGENIALLQKVIENLASRLKFIRTSRDGKLPEIIYKT